MAKNVKVKEPVEGLSTLSPDELLFRHMPTTEANRKLREFDEKAEKIRLARVKKHDAKEEAKVAAVEKQEKENLAILERAQKKLNKSAKK